MKDPRLQKLSRQLIRYSCGLKKGERVLIENFGVEAEFVAALIKETYEVGADPVVVLRDQTVQRALMMGANAAKWDEEAKLDAERMRGVDAYIGIRGGNNGYETADVPADKMSPIHAALQQAGPQRNPLTQDPVGGAALSYAFHGAVGRNQSGGV